MVDPSLAQAILPPADGEDGIDTFGAEEAALRLAVRLSEVRSQPVTTGSDGGELLRPGFSRQRDRVIGPGSPHKTLLVFGAFGTPAARGLGAVIAGVRRRHPATVAVAWRHYPDPLAHPRAAILALAAEAAAAQGRFWALTQELLTLRHTDPPDLHRALRRADLDPGRTLAMMRAGVGADRIVADTESALASGVAFSPTLFIDSEQVEGPVDGRSVSDALAQRMT